MMPVSALALVIIAIGNYLIYYQDSAAGPWVTLVGLFLCLIAFSPGVGSQSFVLNSEIHPLQVRSEALSLITAINLLTGYLTTAFFLTVTTTSVGKVATYSTLAGVCCLVWVFLYKVLPETKGIPLSDIPELFLSPEKKVLAEEIYLQFFGQSSDRKKQLS